MNAFDVLLGALVTHGPMLLLGSTIVLAGGCLGMLLHRDPAQRRRLGIATACGCFAYLLLAIVPLPRVFGVVVADQSATANELAVVDAPLDPVVRALAIRRALDAEPGPAAPTLVDTGAARTTALPAAVPTAAPTTRPLPWASVLAITWVLGAAFVLLRATWGLVCLRILLRNSREAPGALLRDAALSRHVRLRIARTAVRPFCTGWLRPVVVVGPELLAADRRAQALAVVRHEAAHLRARDPLVQMLLAALAVPLFCHPLFWWLCRQVRFHSELLADDAAAAASRTWYARELIDLLGRDQPALAGPGTVAVFHRPSDFYRRIQMLLQREGSLSTSTSRARRFTHAIATLSLVAAAAGLFGVPATAQDPQGRALRKQNETLRAELDEMRTEIARLREEMQRTPIGNPPTGTSGELPLVLEEPPPAPPNSSLLGRLGILRQEALRGSLDEVLGKVPPKTDFAEVALRIMNARAATPAPAPDDVPPLGTVEIGTELLEYRKMAEIPTLTDLPIVGRVFLPGEDGLPTTAVNVAPPERSAQVATTEATADLTSRYLDLQAELELAEVTATETKQLADQGFAPTTEARKAAVQLRTLQKKLAIVKKLVSGEIDATQCELQWLEQKHKEADKTDRLRLDIQMHRARMRLEALASVK